MSGKIEGSVANQLITAFIGIRNDNKTLKKLEASGDFTKALEICRKIATTYPERTRLLQDSLNLSDQTEDVYKFSQLVAKHARQLASRAQIIYAASRPPATPVHSTSLHNRTSVMDIACPASPGAAQSRLSFSSSSQTIPTLGTSRPRQFDPAEGKRSSQLTYGAGAYTASRRTEHHQVEQSTLVGSREEAAGYSDAALDEVLKELGAYDSPRSSESVRSSTPLSPSRPPITTHNNRLVPASLEKASSSSSQKLSDFYISPLNSPLGQTAAPFISRIPLPEKVGAGAGDEGSSASAHSSIPYHFTSELGDEVRSRSLSGHVRRADSPLLKPIALTMAAPTTSTSRPSSADTRELVEDFLSPVEESPLSGEPAGEALVRPHLTPMPLSSSALPVKRLSAFTPFSSNPTSVVKAEQSQEGARDRSDEESPVGGGLSSGSSSASFTVGAGATPPSSSPKADQPPPAGPVIATTKEEESSTLSSSRPASSSSPTTVMVAMTPASVALSAPENPQPSSPKTAPSEKPSASVSSVAGSSSSAANSRVTTVAVSISSSTVAATVIAATAATTSEAAEAQTTATTTTVKATVVATKAEEAQTDATPVEATQVATPPKAVRTSTAEVTTTVQATKAGRTALATTFAEVATATTVARTAPAKRAAPAKGAATVSRPKTERKKSKQ